MDAFINTASLAKNPDIKLGIYFCVRMIIYFFLKYFHVIKAMVWLILLQPQHSTPKLNVLVMTWILRFIFVFLDIIVDFLKNIYVKKCENNGVCDEKTHAYCRCTIAFYGNNVIKFFLFDWCSLKCM